MSELGNSLAEIRQIGIDYANSESFLQRGALKIYCKPCSNFEELIAAVRSILSLQKRVCFVNVQLAVILQSQSSKRYSLFYASGNVSLLETQVRIAKQSDKAKLIKKIENIDLENHLYYPGSDYVVSELSYVRVIITQDGNLPLTCGCRQNLAEIPANLLRNQNITCQYSINHKVTVGKIHKTPCNLCDKLCFFHAISAYFRKVLKVQTLSDGTPTTCLQLFRLYCCRTNVDPRTFDGIYLHQFDYLETLFKLRINIYSYEGPSGGYHIKADELRVSQLEDSENGTCNLLRIGLNHIVFVRGDIYKLLGFLVCKICFARIKHRNNFIRHVRLCAKRSQVGVDGEPTKIYHSGTQFIPKMNLFEQIIFFCGKDHFADPSVFESHYLSTMDCETFYECMEANPQLRGKATNTVGKLRLLVIGVVSNVEGFRTPRLFWNSDSVGDELIQYLVRISEKQCELLTAQFASVFDLLEEKRKCAERAKRQDTEKLFKNLIKRLINYTKQHKVILYNGSRFDCKLTKSDLIPAIVKYYGNKPSAIKTLIKDNAYVRINCPNISFLDQCNYCFQAKMSYDDFLFTVLGERSKSLFPYDYLKSEKQLLEQGLPKDLDAWHSRLKNASLLDLEFLAYSEKMASSPAGTSPETVYRSLGYTKIPARGRERLLELEREFEESSCKNLKDWLSRYLILDITPFLAAVEKLSRCFYKQFGRLLYMYPSIPSLGVTVAFRDFLNPAGCEVYVPSKYLYESIIRSVPGGASLIFSLESVAGSTRIREAEFGQASRTVSSIFSLDASKFYSFVYS